MLRDVFLSKSVQPFVLAGSGTLGWDSIASNLLEKGDKVLVVNTGYFGDHIGDCFETYGANPVHLRASEIGGRPSVDEIKNALVSQSFKMIHITHVDTSTGVINDIKEISSIVNKVSPNTLISIDAVCSLGAEELRMDDWNIDITITGSQKALGVPPGLCVIGASPRAIKTFEERKTPVSNYYVSWKNWLPIMKNYEARKGSYFATPPVSLIIALHTSLKQFHSKMEERFASHKKTSARIKDQLEDWGFKLVPINREFAANTLTAVYFPTDKISAADVLPKIASHNVILAGGLHKQISSKYFRIGHMGISAVDNDRPDIDLLLNAIKKGFEEAGYSKL
jgi:alanine-glyoxylate transaminase/serine-glyoxylate transaminase/serine-pyruvate transaminase